MKLDRELLQNIISKWKDIKALRLSQPDQLSCINTSAKLLIKKYVVCLSDTSVHVLYLHVSCF